jgi:sulfur carrier protein
MIVTVNGDSTEVVDGATVPMLLDQLGVRPRSVVVELNGNALMPSELPGVVLQNGDVVELVRAVAGG